MEKNLNFTSSIELLEAETTNFSSRCSIISGNTQNVNANFFSRESADRPYVCMIVGATPQARARNKMQK